MSNPEIKKKLTFKEYYDSLERLRLASNTLPKMINEYVVKKYCKIPVFENNKKNYISLKPKDIINILWEFIDIKTPQAKSITFDQRTYLPSWHTEKLKKWIETTTIEKSR